MACEDVVKKVATQPNNREKGVECEQMEEQKKWPLPSVRARLVTKSVSSVTHALGKLSYSARQS